MASHIQIQLLPKLPSFFSEGLGKKIPRKDKEMTVTGNIFHFLFKFRVSMKSQAPNRIFFFKTLHPMSMKYVEFSQAATQPKENPDFNQTYLQHLNEESGARWMSKEPRDYIPHSTSPATVLPSLYSRTVPTDRRGKKPRGTGELK